MKNALLPRSDIPNQAGFVLLLVRADGSEQLAKVAQGFDGAHYCATPSGKRISLSQTEPNPMQGWRKYVRPTGPACPGMNCLPHPALYTRDQLAGIMAGWQCTEPAPRKGNVVWVNFNAGADFPLACVQPWEGKSITGHALWAVWLYRKAA